MTLLYSCLYKIIENTAFEYLDELHETDRNSEAASDAEYEEITKIDAIIAEARKEIQGKLSIAQSITDKAVAAVKADNPDAVPRDLNETISSGPAVHDNFCLYLLNEHSENPAAVRQILKKTGRYISLMNYEAAIDYAGERAKSVYSIAARSFLQAFYIPRPESNEESRRAWRQTLEKQAEFFTMEIERIDPQPIISTDKPARQKHERTTER